MNHSDVLGNIFHLVSLQMTDHMPADILWQRFMLCAELLNIILAEIPVAGCVELFNHLVGLSLADCDQRDVFR